jgi:hypothetical protein
MLRNGLVCCKAFQTGATGGRAMSTLQLDRE